MKYLLDTNVFIRSKNDLPEDVWPTFWKRITELITKGDIAISEKVKEEIDNGGDELAEWINRNVQACDVVPVDAEVLRKYSEVQNWAKGTGQFKPVALEDFARVADAYLVATAAAKGWTLVTFEKSQPNSKSRVKIPDACKALGVKVCDLNAAFKSLGVQV